MIRFWCPCIDFNTVFQGNYQKFDTIIFDYIHIINRMKIFKQNKLVNNFKKLKKKSNAKKQTKQNLGEQNYII